MFYEIVHDSNDEYFLCYDGRMRGECGERCRYAADKHRVSEFSQRYCIGECDHLSTYFYPYHFVKNGAEPNELGKRDLAVLIRHFWIKQAGHLNIRKYNIPAEIYEARVESVHKKLQEAGINMDQISIPDDMPGGSGIASENILIILAEEDELAPTEN